MLIAGHLVLTAGVAAIFARHSGYDLRVVAAHVLLAAEWDLALLCLVRALVAFGGRPSIWPRRAAQIAAVVTGTAQLYLYALNIVSNLSWNRNMTAHLVSAFAPTVWSGKEPFPVGAAGISAFALGALALMIAGVNGGRAAFDAHVHGWPARRASIGRRGRWGRRLAYVTLAVAAFSAAGTTVAYGIGSQSLYWKQELVASFFRREGFAFEPTERRHAVAARDAVIRASYPREVAGARKKHVILIIVDSLRADRMQVYGYGRPTTPFLAGLVQDGQMHRVEAAFSTCSESFCGITSTLAGREFKDISARTYQLQDVLRDQGYRTWFLLSGNHTAWNGLPQFYHADDGALFDGSQTQRYTMDDDRLVLEGLEQVPPAASGQPAFFYVHLMSPHYLGVQLPTSHLFTRPDDHVSPGKEPYTILERLNKPDRYDDKVLQADRIIEQLFEALRAKHYLDDAVVVITGDHGEGLGERHWAHGWHLYNEDIRVPMLWYEMPAASYPELPFAAHVDIAPTILDRLGLPIPESWSGQSLMVSSPERFTRHQTYFLPNRFAVLYRRDGRLFKFIATPQYGTEELYDLVNDRTETHNIAAAQPALVARLRDQVSAYRRDELSAR